MKNGESIEIPTGEEPPTETAPWTVIQELPDYEGNPCRAYTLSAPPQGGLPDGFATIDLRSSYYALPYTLYNLAGKAAELLYWESNTKFCGVCGAPMKRHTSISKRCTNCGKEVWPQVAPAIIVRILKAKKADSNGNVVEPEQILLVHARNFRRSDYFGLVAGFVETGETLEDCVRREVHEEVHLDIENIRYFGSQPWPYPCGIMIGFTADYRSGEVQLQDKELTNGGWYTKENLPHIPDKMSIARRLIDDWIG